VQKEHGRETDRRIAVKAVDPMEVGFPHVQTVLHVRRQTSTKKNAAQSEDAYYLSSQAADARSPEQWLQTIRDHWAGVEIRNHWRKDACLFEDKTRSRRPALVGNLILLRNLVLHFFADHQETYGSLPAFVEAVAARSSLALRLLRSAK
jgi:predicted transposase YbfD/YdcC